MSIKDKLTADLVIILISAIVAWAILYTIIEPRNYAEPTFVEWCDEQNLDTSDYSDGAYEYQYQKYLLETNQ